MTTDIVKNDSMNPAQLLTLAVDKDLDIDKLRQLMELQKAWEANQSRKAYFSALSDFQDQCPDIRKSKKVGFDLKQGGRTDYNYAPLGDIDRQIKKLMKACGLTKNWKIFDNAGRIKVICHITHIEGHSEATEMEADADMSGSKNAIQGKGSAIEYMKRYTLTGALGITTADDVDGQIPDIDIDLLHKQYMIEYGKLIQIDSKYSKWEPSNWKTEPTQKVYLKAISEIRKKLIEVTPKEA